MGRSGTSKAPREETRPRVKRPPNWLRASHKVRIDNPKGDRLGTVAWATDGLGLWYFEVWMRRQDQISIASTRLVRQPGGEGYAYRR